MTRQGEAGFGGLPGREGAEVSYTFVGTKQTFAVLIVSTHTQSHLFDFQGKPGYKGEKVCYSDD